MGERVARRRWRRPAAVVLLAPYDPGEMAMLGEAGAGVCEAVIGLHPVEPFTGRWSCLVGAPGTLGVPALCAVTRRGCDPFLDPSRPRT